MSGPECASTKPTLTSSLTLSLSLHLPSRAILGNLPASARQPPPSPDGGSLQLVLGVLFQGKSRILIHDVAENTREDMDATASNCYYAAVLYIITFGWSVWQMRVSPPPHLSLPACLPRSPIPSFWIRELLLFPGVL